MLDPNEENLDSEALTDEDAEVQDALTEAAEALADQEEPGLPAAATEKGRDLVPSNAAALATEEIEDSTLGFIQSFNRQLDEIQEMKDVLEAEAANLKKELAARDRTIAQQRRRMTELEQELQRAAQLETEIDRLESTMEARDGELSTIKSELSAREAAIKQKDSFIAELNASHDAMVSKTIEVKEEMQALKEERTRMSAQVEALNSEKEEILNEKRRVEQAMNQLDAKYQAAHDEVMSAKKILGELQSAFETSQRKARAILDKKMRGSGG